jgi:tetratricopeptide (TPR) repeat protein
MRTPTRILGTLALVVLLGACGGAAQQQVSDDERRELDRQSQADLQKQQDEARRLEAEKKFEEELTIKKLIIPTDVKYVPGVSEEAQVRFRDGVIALYQQPPKFDDALAAFKDAVKLDKDFIEAWFNLGMTHERMGAYDKATEVYGDLLKAKPDNVDAKGYLARLALIRAKKAFDLGKTQEFERQANEAKKISGEILAKNPENVTANNAMALYNLLHDKLDAAEDFVKNVLTVEPANVTALTTRGLIFLKKGDLRLARWTFEQKVIHEDPNVSEAYGNLGIVYYKLNNMPGAVKNFKKAIEVDADNMQARLNYGAILLNYLNYAAAEQQYDYVLKAQSDNVEAIVGLGSCYYGQKKFPEAIAAYEKAYKLDGRKIELLERIGYLYEAFLNKMPEAFDYYRRYIQLAKLGPNADLVLKVNLLEKMWKEQQMAPPPAPEGTPAPDGAAPAPADGTPAPAAAPAPAAPAAEPAPATSAVDKAAAPSENATGTNGGDAK